MIRRKKITKENKEPAATRRKLSGTKIFVSVIAFVLLATIASSLWMGYYGIDFGGNDLARNSELENDGNQASFSGEVESIEDVANKLSPSVVSIVTTTEVSDSSFNRFFASQEVEGSGTGVVVSDDGYILTNKHVVEGSSSLSIVLSDGTRHESVEIAATDPLNDIAFLKIDGVSGLTPAELGDSKTLRIGQQVVAIGNALGQYQNTITSGIISGTNRSVTASRSDGSGVENLTDMIQTDASINSGNSGGPLVNAGGQVIGINTAVASNAQGIGFAIPIGATKGMLAEVLENGSADRAYMGVNYLQITPEVAQNYDLPVSEGAYVFSEGGSPIVSGGPADRAGLRSQDIITKINGVDVGQKGSIASLTAEYRVGDRISVTVYRDGRETDLVVELASYQSSS